MTLDSPLRRALAALLLLGLPAGAVLSAQDYNSSRSNKTASAAAPSEVENLLDQARAEASTVAKTMIAADQRDGYAGDYEIAVNVSVSIKRVRSR
jgi:uncharacterized membrane protein YebE (DUF533 family)